MRTPRAEPRITKSLPVRVWGMDGNGHPINLDASTIDISEHGARLGGLTCWRTPGEIIAVRHGIEKARFRIVWVGLPGTPYAAQIGLKCVETGKQLWGELLQSAAAEPLAARAAAAGVTPASLPHSLPTSVRPAWTAPPAPPPAAGGDLRRSARFRCDGGAKVQLVGSDVSQWATLSDISSGGCYIETTAPYGIDLHVDFSLDVAGYRIQGRGVVKIVHRNVGMGIEFKEMTAENRARLLHVLTALAEPPRPTF